MEKQRHGFVSFWLYLMLIMNVIVVIVALYKLAIGGGYLLKSLMYVSITSYIVNAIGAWMLLSWKKLGFWLFAVACVGTMVVNIFTSHSTMGIAIAASVLGSGLSLLVQWAILQIKKDGASCWSLLE